MIPRIPLATPDLRGEEAAALQRCVAANWVSSAGPDVVTLEERMAALSGRRHAVATASGSAGLALALCVAGVGPGDHVVVPDWTFAATANAVLHAGARPWFVDVTEASWTLDPALLEALSGDPAGASIRAVIAVHALGHPADMDAIAAVCAARGWMLIEDAAGAIGATYRGRPAGGLAEAAVFSFNGNKTVTTGGGGMLVTDREDWAARARSLSTQARIGGAYRYAEAGFNYRMPNVNAALGVAQLDRLSDLLAAKRAIAARYDAALAGRPDLRPMPRCDWAESGCWLYSVRSATRADAAALVTHLDAAAIEARPFWEALSDQPPYAGNRVARTGIAEHLSGTVVSLPCSTHLAESDQARVIEALATWRGRALKAAA